MTGKDRPSILEAWEDPMNTSTQKHETLLPEHETLPYKHNHIRMCHNISLAPNVVRLHLF